MRILSTIIPLIGMLLAACSSETVAQPPPAPVDWRSLQVARTAPDAGAGPTANERAAAEAYAAALESPGLGQLASRLDDDCHFASPGMNDGHGRDSVVRAHEVLFGAFDPRKFTMNRVWRTDVQQSVAWTMSGTQARDWMGLAATHKPVAFRGLTILWTRDDGSISDVHVYFDVAVVKAQLGVGPKELVNLPPHGPAQPASGSPQVFEKTGSAEEKNNVVAARVALDALENNDQAAYLTGMTDDVEVHTLERAQPMRGKDDARAYFKTMRKAIGQLDTTVDNASGVAQFAVVEYEISGEQLGPIGWIAPQRNSVIRLHVVDVVELRDGKIARVWRYDNPGEIVSAVK
jgi:ketosteroid isomerase-like protein/predicted ester cyclase